MGLLGNSKWGPGGANDNDDAESHTPPPHVPKAPRWKDRKANERAAGNEQPGTLGNGIDHGYGNSVGRAPNTASANVQRQGGNTQRQSLSDHMTRDGAPLNGPRFENGRQDGQHLDANTRQGYGYPQSTQRFDNTNQGYGRLQNPQPFGNTSQQGYGHHQNTRRYDNNNNNTNHGYGASPTGRGNPNFPQPENMHGQDSIAQSNPLSDWITRDALFQDTPRYDSNTRGVYNASSTSHPVPSDTTQHQGTTAQPPPQLSPYERMARDAGPPQHTSIHPSPNSVSTARTAPPARQDTSTQPVQRTSNFFQAAVEDEETTPTQSTFTQNVASKFAVEPVSTRGPKVVVKRPAAKVVGRAATAPVVEQIQVTPKVQSTTASAVTSSTPVGTATPAPAPIHTTAADTDMATFRIPPQSTLSDADFFFLIGKLRGRTVTIEEWEGAVAKVQGIEFKAPPIPPPASTTTAATDTIAVTETEEVEVEETAQEVIGVVDKGKGKAKAEKRLSDEFARLMALEEVEGEEDEL
jgi:hypothetical protein